MKVTNLTQDLRLGDADWCIECRDVKGIRTLHITTPGEEMCAEAFLVRHKLKHGSMLDDGRGGLVMGWNEYLEPLTMDMLRGAVDWYKSVKEDGDSAFVHCAAGLHRSPTVCLALLASDGMSLWKSIPLVIDRMRKYGTSIKNKKLSYSPMWEQADLELVAKFVQEELGVK